MPLLLPNIPEAEATPLVRQLLEIIRSRQERLQQLEDEIARLKGLKTRPVIAPSRLETPPPSPPELGQKRPGSGKRPKNADFRGQENNQSFWGRKPRFLGDLAISALGSLIVYLARNDSIGILSTLAVL
jgi:hypothetical protein